MKSKIMLPYRNIVRLLTTSSSAVTQAMPHVPVMADLVTEHLNLSDGKTIIDMTFGAGGHTKRLLKK
jgi:NifU-like protein involved in Fe-S cluster formation